MWGRYTQNHPTGRELKLKQRVIISEGYVIFYFEQKTKEQWNNPLVIQP